MTNSSIDQPFQELDTQLIADLTFLMPFLPTCLSLLGGILTTATMMVKRNQIRKLRMVICNMLWMYYLVPLAFLPYVQIVVNIILSFWVTAAMWIDLFDQDLIFPDQENFDDRELEGYQLTEDQLQADSAKTAMNLGKTAETIGESAPQFILQMAILLILSGNPLRAWDYLLDDHQKAGFWSSMLVVLTTSYLSIIWSGGSYIVESKISVGCIYFTPHMTLPMLLGNAFAMIFVATPRLFSLALISSIFSSYYAAIALGTGLIVYVLGLIVLIYMFKKELPELDIRDEYGSRKLGLFMMGLSSIFMPCIIINPTWNILSFTSILSASILIVELLVLIGIIDLWPHLLRPSMIEDPTVFRLICIAAILGLILSMSITALQVALIRRAHLQNIRFQVLFGDIKAVEERLKSDKPLRLPWIFRYACHVQQEDMVELLLKYGQGKIDFNAGGRMNGYSLACLYKNERIKTMIEENAEKLDIDLNNALNKNDA